MTRIPTSTDDKPIIAQKIKFLYNYGGRILPRPSDGKLRYAGGHTRVLSVDRNVTFADLTVIFLELSGSSTTLKCKLPTDDLDVLVTITCDEDLAAIVSEYDRWSKDLKVTAVLFPRESLKEVCSPPPSTTKSFLAAGLRCRNPSLAVGFPVGVRKDGGGVRCFDRLANASRHVYFVPHGNYWQQTTDLIV